MGTKFLISVQACTQRNSTNFQRLSKDLQYISKDSRELPIVFGNYKNEGHKGTAKTFVGPVEEYLLSKSRLYPNLLD